jgi:hypothetical protein
VTATDFDTLVKQCPAVEEEAMATDATRTLQRVLDALRADQERLAAQAKAIQGALRVLSEDGAAPAGRKRMSATRRVAIGRRMQAMWRKKRKAGAK